MSVFPSEIKQHPATKSSCTAAPTPTPLSRRICLYVIDVHLLLCGVDLKSSSGFFREIIVEGRFRSALILISRSITLFSIVLYLIGKSIRISQDFQSSPDINKMFFIWYVIIAGLLFMEIARSQWNGGAMFRRILLNPRNEVCLDCRRVLAWVFCLSVWTTVDLYLVFSNQQTRGLSQETNDEQITDFRRNLRIISERCEVFLFQAQHNCYLFFLIVPKIIQCRLEKLRDSIADSSLDGIRESKEDIRSTTKAFNALFSRIGSFLYVKVVAVGYRIIILLTTQNHPIRRIQILNSCLQFVILYDIASVGTEIITLCRSLPAVFTVRQRSKLPFSALYIGSTELSYDMTRDAVLLSNCFTNEKAMLLSYTCTVITSIAILLQFDYKIMAQFDDLKMSLRFH